MNILKTDISINRPSHEVWNVLISDHNYHVWNPFIQKIEGVLMKDAEVKVTLFPYDDRIYEFVKLKFQKEGRHEVSLFSDQTTQLNKTSSFKVKVDTFIENEFLTWSKKSFFLGSYRHEFRLSAKGESETLFENEIQMTGKLVNLGWEQYIKHYYEGGLELMNRSLKTVAESEEFYFDDELHDLRN